MSFDSDRKQYEKRPFQYVEIEVGATTYRFCRDVSPLPSGIEAQPTLKNLSVSPAQIRLEGGLGVREKVTMAMTEAQDYTTWGTLSNPVRFWSRWRAENPYYKGQRVSVFSGYIVNGAVNTANFIRRDYIMESFSQSAAGVQITAKDPLKFADDDRAKAPRESRGSLSADITDTQTSFTLQPSGIGNSEYPSSNFYVRIGDEVILVGSRSGDTCSSLTRGTFNTVADDHSTDDNVQLCLYYEDKKVSFIDHDLLTNYTNVDPSYINLAEWTAENDNNFPTTYTALITEPTGVKKLINELADSAPHYVYTDVRTNEIKFKALRPPPTDAQQLTFFGNILKGSTGVTDKQDMRVSTVIVNYGIIDPTKDLDEVSNYRSSYIREDTDSVTNYGQRAYKKINSRWISSDNKTAAVLMSSRVGRRFAEAPRQVSYALDAKDADVWVGDSVKIRTDLIEQAGGGFPTLFYQVLSAKEDFDRANYQYSALEHTYGDAVPGDEDVEDPNVKLVYISNEQDQLKDPDTATPRTLRDIFDEVFGSPVIDDAWDIRFIFESNCVAGSSDNTKHGVDTGSWPGTLTQPIKIQNNNLIVGKGGDGANLGGTAEDGGPALILNADIRLENFGTIGGGGGGGVAVTNSEESTDVIAAGGGGGGYTNGLGATGSNVNPPEDEVNITPAENGTNTAGGAGAVVTARTDSGVTFQTFGQPGGDLGQAGSGTGGGAAGKAIDLNGYTITYIETGTIAGAVS